MKRIYDAAFEMTTGSEHWHLGRFWWVENGYTGQWTREEAYDYVRNHAQGDVYVAEGAYSVTVYAYHNQQGTHWIQTEADGVRRDNLTELAERHRQGLPNQ